MWKDLEVPYSWLVRYDEKVFVIIIDLNFGKLNQEKERNAHVKPFLDDGFGGGVDDVSNTVFRGWGGKSSFNSGCGNLGDLGVIGADGALEVVGVVLRVGLV